MKPGRAVFIISVVLFLWFLWGHDLWAPDEPFFAEGAREMLVDGQWLVTHINGVVNSHKPPLLFWFIAVFSIPFGAVTEFTARLPSVLAALGTVALVLRLGGRWFGPRTAALAGLILATSYMFWDKARWSQIDSLLCFLIWIALAAFESWRSGEADGRRAGMLFWCAGGLAVLAKGPVGLLLILGVVIVFLVGERDLGSLRRFAPLAGPLVFVAVTGAWVTVVTLWGPADYSVLGALKEHFVDRGLYGMHHAQPFWYYAERLPTSLLPWSGLLPGALIVAWRYRRHSEGLRFSLATAIFIVVFFSISTEKRDLYVLPAFPALALLMSALVARVAGWRDELPGDGDGDADVRWVTIGQGVIGGLFFFGGVAAPILSLRLDFIPVWMAVVVAVVLLTTGTAIFAAVARRRVLGSVLATAFGMTVIHLIAPSLVYPAMDPMKSSRSLALEIRHHTEASRAAGHDVMAWRAGNIPTAVAFYSDGVYTAETEDVDVLSEHMRQEAQVFALVNTGDIEEVPADVRDSMRMIVETRLSRRDVALVANR